MSKSVIHETDILTPKYLGEILLRANLILPAQLEVALRDKHYYDHMLLGEILASRGWVNQQTADFFADQWSKIIQSDPRHRLGSYLRQAALLNLEQIDAIIQEQNKTGLRFGALAVLNGWLQQATLDFFLESLFPDQMSQPPFMRRARGFSSSKKPNSITNLEQCLPVKSATPEKSEKPEENSVSDVPWIG